jgi:hypothetical protein
MANESQKLAAALGIVDFNEWAGTKIASSAHDRPLLTVARLVPSLCCQASEKVRSKSAASSFLLYAGGL